MKRFHWPLQRLLDVTAQRERSQRAELMALSRQIARRRQEVLSRQAMVEGALAELAAVEFAERIRKHDVLMKCAEAQQRRIDRLEVAIAQLGVQRSEKARQLLRIRKNRQTLERLREEARQEHIREQLKIEQKQFDESAHVSKARRLIEARAGSAE